MSFSEILNMLLGGGLIALIVALATMKATVRKANAEAEKARSEAAKAEAEAESVRIDNAEHATRVLIQNIVKPLKNEFNETKEELMETKKELARNTREMARLRKALDGANSCEHRGNCPVLAKLRDNQKDTDGADADGSNRHSPRHRTGDNQDNTDGSSAGEPGGDDDIRGQPP